MHKPISLLTALSVFLAVSMLAGLGNRDAPTSAPGRQVENAMVSSLAACTPDTSGMSSYWPLDDGPATPPRNFEDVVGSNPGNCAVTQTCPSSGSGKVGTAFNFDGNDRINVADDASLNFELADSFSLEAWFKTGDDCIGTIPNRVIIGEYNGANGAAWWLGCGPDDPLSENPNIVAIFSLRASMSGDIQLNGTAPINDNEWHHVVGVRDSNSDENLLYVDGQLANSINANNTYTGTFSGPDFVTIGYYQSGQTPPFQPGYHFIGALDEVAVYGKALSLEEIQAHYSNGMGQSYCKEAPQVVNPGDQENSEGDTGIALQIQAAGDYGSTLTYSMTGAPPGLSINASTGLISGSLGYDAAAGSPYTVQVTATNDAAPPESGSVTFSWVVNNVNRAPVVEDPGTQNSAEGASISLPILASDPDGNALTFTASGLPPDLSINPNTGVISGTISYGAYQGSAYQVTVTATDNGSPKLSDSVTFAWNVSNTNRKPEVVKPKPQVSRKGEYVSLQVIASDPDGDPITFSATGLPGGLAINASTGLISGTVTAEPGSIFTVILAVTDGKPGGTKTVQFTWTITDKWYIYQPVVIRSSP